MKNLLPPYSWPHKHSQTIQFPSIWLVCENLSLRLYWLPVAVVTNDHKCSGLKHHKCIILQSWRSPKSFSLGWSKMLAELLPSGVSESRICSCLFQLLDAIYIPRLVTPSLYPSNILFPCDIFSSWFWSSRLPTSSKDSYDYIVPMWISHGEVISGS